MPDQEKNVKEWVSHHKRPCAVHVLEVEQQVQHMHGYYLVLVHLCKINSKSRNAF